MVIENTPIDRAALERFQETHPGLESAKAIAGIPETTFVEQYATEIEGGEREARRVHKTAVNIAEHATLIWANIKDTVASPFLGQTLFNNIPREFIDYHQSIPDYDRLFSKLDFIECDHCRSIFGPAAYFVDLMRFVEENITNNKTNNSGLEQALTLDARRPDLARIRLDCYNTSDLIPYIDLVNEVLEAIVTRDSPNPDAYAVLEETYFPSNLPFHLPLAQIRSYLQQLKTSLKQLYQAFETNPGANLGPITREFLELAPEEFSLLIAEITQPDKLTSYYDTDVTRTDLGGLTDVATFLQQTSLSRQELDELVSQDLDQDEFNAGLSRLFFINNVDDGLGPLTIIEVPGATLPTEILMNLSTLKLERIYRFVKLTRRFGWSLTELDWILRSLSQSYTPEPVLNFDGINDYIACRNIDGTLHNLDVTAFTIEAWVNPTRLKKNPILAKGAANGPKTLTHFLFWIDLDGRLGLYHDETGIEQGHNTTFDEIRSVGTIPANAFSHVAVAVDEAKARFYINGTLDQEVALPNKLTPLGSDLHIGHNLDDTYFEGNIKEVRIWQGVRDAAWIAADVYRRQTGRERNLVGYWPLTRSLWSRLDDLSDSYNYGTPGGADLTTQPTWVLRDLVLDPLPSVVDGNGPAFHFNGSDQYLAHRNATGAATEELTVEIWINLDKLRDNNTILWLGDDASGSIQLGLWADSTGKLNCQIGNETATSQTQITVGQPAHLSVSVANNVLRMYINGTLDKEYVIQTRVSFELHNKTLLVGSSLDRKYYQGTLQELRLWARARSATEIVMAMYRPALRGEPGLVGYWPLTQIDPAVGSTTDLSYNANDLYLGGILSDYTPTRIDTSLLLPTPIKTTAPVLHFDGINDVVIVNNPQNVGLGKYERLTLQFWFKADDITPDRQQVLYSQGDGEAGLSIYIAGGKLYVVVWDAEFDLTNVQSTVFSTSALPGQWQHLAVTSDASLALDTVALQAYLDGEQFGSATPIYTHAPLSPVGPVSLGGIGENAITRFQEAYSDAETRSLHYFVGNIADFRFANTAASVTAIAAERFAAPAANPADLVAYLPLDEGQSESFTDQTGHGNTGSLVPRNMVLASRDSQNNWDNIYAHYKDPAALTWTNYAYTGRINLRDAKSAGGVTFFSHHPEHLDQFYAFWWSPTDSALHISAHPLGLRPVSDWKLSNISPAYGTWYRFRIEAVDDGKQTIIKAKVWAENTAEPADFQITVNDASHLRSKAGTVGISATQGIAVDDLLVQPLSAPSGEPATPLLIEHFEEYVASDPSTTWSQTGTKQQIVPNTTLFKITKAPGTDNLLVFGSQGTYSELEDAHTHYTGTGSATWSNYAYQGRLYVSDVTSALGLTFFSGYPTVDAYYRILCYQEQPTFLLDRHPFDAPPLKGTLDSGVTPTPATWYRFRIEVQQAGSRITIKARLWKDGTSEPANFQIDAYDDTDQRLRSGTVGAWTVGSGTNLLDRLIVAHVDLSTPWDEKNNDQNGHDAHDTSSYVQLRVHGNASSSWWTVVQRRDDGSKQWNDVWKSNLIEKSGDTLRKTWKVDPKDLFDANKPATHGWYRWNVYTEQNGILLFTSGEFHAPAQSGHTLVTEATVNILLSTNFGTNKTDQVPDGWTNTTTQKQPQDATQLFEIRDFKDNRAQWQAQVMDYPLLRHPLNRKALHFDGKLEYAATAILQESLQGINSNAFTLEAWVNPTDASRAYPLACCRLNGTALLALAIDGNGKLTVQTADNATILLQSVTALHPGTFTHIALSIADNQAIFYVNGAPDPALTLTIPPALLSSLITLLTQPSNLEIEIGRGVDGTCFAGAIKEIRVWNSARTPAQIVAGQFERPVLPVADLVVYWPCGEDAGLIVQDVTGNDNQLWLGGLAQARWPTLIPRPAARLDRHELHPTHALTFANPNDYIELSDDADDQPRERRTVEMWFKVDDTTITHRKQIIYREGDDQRGLIVYVHNGTLYLGGYNLPANESNWPGTWLQTDRLTAGTWHQAALVLDGRAETRPETLQAYMDGQLVDVGQGSQLWQVGRKLSLGGANGAARFHDGLISDADSHFLSGQVIDLRLWDTARTPVEIGPYQQVPQQPFDAHLVLWLQAQALPPELTFFDRAATGQVGTLTLKRPDQWQPLAALPVYSLPLIGLDEPTLVEIATIKRLKDNLNVPLTQLSALWYTIKHTGAANGSVLWDQIFNSSGMVQDAWPPCLDQPIRWEIVGNTDRDRKISSRLMAVLHLTLPDLITLVARLSPGEMIIELDSSYLTNLFRLARTSSLLGLSVSNLLRLLDMLGITYVQRLDDFQQVNDRVAWLQQTGLSVGQLDYLVNDRQSKLAGPAYDDAAIRDLATSLASQSKDFLIIASTFVSNQISQSQAIQLFAWLGKSGLIDARGALTAKYSGPGDLNDLANQPGWDPTQLGKVRGEIDAKLAASRDGLDQAVLTGLSGLLGAKSDLTRVATVHLAPKLDAIAFFNLMLSIQETQPIPPAIIDYLYQLNKILYLAGQFDLSAAATGTLLDYPAHFGVKEPVKPDIQDLEHLYTYKALNAAYPDNSDLLLSLLSRADGDTAGITADVLALTGWELNQLTVLTTYFGAGGADRVTWLNRLKQCFDLAATMLVDINFLIQLTATNRLDYTFYKEQAASLLQVLRAGYDDNTWPGVYQPIHDALAVQQRDGLLSLALQQLGKQYQGRKDADILYEYLLLDVQTGSEVQTSRIVQATASVQLYVQRGLMNLEKGVLPESIPTKEWEWMQNYRVWEANRKVFLYPENYIEPELRTDKTPLFAQLQQDLTQGEMSQATVQKAYIKYLDSFKEIASLKVTGSYLYDPTQDPSRQDQSLDADLSPVLYLLGRTDTDPRTYYYRQFKPNSRQWFPWQKIDVQIPADFVSPVFAFNRLFLFWPEFIKTVKPVDKLASAADRQAGKEVDSQNYLTSHGIRLQENQDIWQASVKYIYFNFDKSWIQPQTFPFFGVTGQELSTEQHLRPEWQRVYAQQSFEFVAPTNDQQSSTSGSEEQETNAQVLRITPNTDIRVMVPANAIQDQMTWSFWANFTKPINTITVPAQSVVLLSYDEPQGGVRATVTQILTPLSTPEEQQRAQDDARVANDTAVKLQQQANDLKGKATQKTDEATTLATQATLASSNVEQAKAAAQTDPNNKDLADALKVAQAQQTAAANAAQTANDEMVNAQNAADAADLKAKQARTDADTLQAKATALQSQMESRDLNLHIEIGNQDKSIDMTLDYRWQHVAITFQYENSGYTVSLYKDGVLVAGPVSLASSRIHAQEVLRIGYKASDDSAEMAEFELWSSIRNASDINTQKDLRPAPQPGLFCIPLNRIEPGAQMQLVDSKTTNDPHDKGLVFHVASVPINVPLPQGKRERLILLYGNQYRSLRDNLEDQNFVLTLIKPPNAAGNLADYDLDLTLSTLIVTRTDGLSINDYAADGTTTLSRYTPKALRQLKEQASAPDNSFGRVFLQNWIDVWSALSDTKYETNNYLLKNLSRHEVSLLDVGNQPGWYILDTGEEQFLVRAERANLKLKTAGERLRFNIPPQQTSLTVGDQVPITMYFEADPELQGPEDASPPFGFTFERLTTRGIYDLSGRLFAGGLDGLLSLTSQRTQEWSFGNYQANPNLVMLLQSFTEPTTDKQVYPIDFNGSYGMYYSEIFFHAPFFIANQLNTNQNFADAQNWYHYIFNPMAQESSNNELGNDRYWRYLPFRNRTMQSLNQILEDPAALQAYHDDPFDPHAIARLRLVAYQKAIVMKYIDNLIDWGDYLFSQNTRESINEAIPLYVLAYTLLGPRPESRPARRFEEAGDYRGIKQQNAGPLPDFLIGSGNGPNGSIAPTPHSSAVMTNFCVTENEQFIGYWDRVGDRLFKIRHSQNIEGVFRQLVLFQSPINPMDLVRAVAGGRDIGSALPGQAVQVPPYRYTFLIDKARDMVSTVIDLGSSLQAALESRDGEALALLENSQEQQILTLTTDIKAREVTIAQTALEALNVSKTSLQTNQQRYQSLINTGLIFEENAAIGLKVTAMTLRVGQGAAKVISALIDGIPDENVGIAGIGGTPFDTVVFGGYNFGAVANAIGEEFEAGADLFDAGSDLAAMQGEFSRRAQDWEYEKSLIEQELQQVEKQIDNATAELANAQQELVIHNKNIAQNSEIAAFLHSKFSTQDLYSWMAARLSGLYFQAYRLAYDMAKSTERALQYELGTDDSFISFGHWDNLKKGLLAGESLMVELNRMDKAFLDRDRRRLQIEKKISLQRTMPTALADLKTNGACEFTLSEVLFDRDFPGHYFRTIKTLAVTINAQVDDSDGIHATLIELGDKVLLQPDADAVRFLLNLAGATEPATSKVRTNWAANQQIAVSHVDPDGDNGMFVLDFIFDNRYFPFEGTGVVSSWRLELPKDTNRFDFNTIQDVVLHLKYNAKADNGKFRDDVRKLVATVK